MRETLTRIAGPWADIRTYVSRPGIRSVNNLTTKFRKTEVGARFLSDTPCYIFSRALFASSVPQLPEPTKNRPKAYKYYTN
jgi:hypothetical protein